MIIFCFYKKANILLFFTLIMKKCTITKIYLGIPASSNPQAYPAAVGLRPVLLVSLQRAERPGSSSQVRSARSVSP